MLFKRRFEYRTRLNYLGSLIGLHIFSVKERTDFYGVVLVLVVSLVLRGEADARVRIIYVHVVARTTYTTLHLSSIT